MSGSKKTKTPTTTKAAAAIPAKKTTTKKRKSKAGKSVKPNFNTYIYRVLKEVRAPRAAAAYVQSLSWLISAPAACGSQYSLVAHAPCTRALGIVH